MENNSNVFEAIKKRVQSDMQMAIRTYSGFVDADTLRADVTSVLDSIIDNYNKVDHD